MIKIKPFQYTEKEYQGLVALNNVVYPDAISTVSEYRYSDENRNPKCVLQRYIFEKDEQIIASYKYQHIIWSYHPQRLFVAVNVHPEHRNQGIGSMMYDHLASEMQLFNLMRLPERTKPIVFILLKNEVLRKSCGKCFHFLI